MRSKTVAVIAFLLALSFLALPPPPASIADSKKASTTIPSPRLTVDARRFNFGSVDEGVDIEHTFKITNTGNAPLALYDAKSTCGCTVAKLTNKNLQSGESSELTIVVDTSMKQSKVEKTVNLLSNDPANPDLELILAMNVRDPHKGMKGDVGAKIFHDEKCISCHVDQGFGLFGGDLYEADCAMCHGTEAKGAVGPGLLGPYSNEVYAKHVADVIAHGSKRHRSMPGFLSEAGGPLNQEQVDSIVKYLAGRAEARAKHWRNAPADDKGAKSPTR
jgi:mono/diheme cytochrome c family protein